jgi:hypothetical protein
MAADGHKKFVRAMADISGLDVKSGMGRRFVYLLAVGAVGELFNVESPTSWRRSWFIMEPNGPRFVDKQEAVQWLKSTSV